MNAVSGEAIPDLPVNVAVIRGARGKILVLNVTQQSICSFLGGDVNRILQALQMPVAGTLEQRRQRLLTAVGVTSLAVGE